MSVIASVSISAQQAAFACDLASQGRYASVDAVVQRGLELLRQETEVEDAEIAALRSLLNDRADGEFVSIANGRTATEAMIAEKRRLHGL